PDERFQNYADLRAMLGRARQRQIPAPLFPRIMAFVFDFVPFMIVNMVTQLTFHRYDWSQLLLWLVAAIVFASVDAWRGRTWGKRLMGLQLIDDLGNRIHFRAALVRSLVRLW